MGRKNRYNNSNHRYLDLSTMLLALSDLAHSCAEKKVLALRILQILQPFISRQEYQRIRKEIEEDAKICREVFEK